MSRPTNNTAVVAKRPDFIECYSCEQQYITDIKRLHGDNGMQFLNFIAMDQFIRLEKSGVYAGYYRCVDSSECRMRAIYRSLRELGHDC